MASNDESDRRQERRKQVRIASILVDATRSPIPCVILDISTSGARLHVHVPAEVPDRFRLIEIANNQERDCTVVWRKGNTIGVQFTV